MTSSSAKICFNSNCKDVLEQSRKGWRLRTGESADLCTRCASVYEEQKFCETYHLNDSGWRCCESCGKQIHCGCIVSFHMFVLLDAGGIECISCARKSYILTPNPAWPPPSLLLSVQPERMKDFSVKNWSQVGGSGHLPRHQASSLSIISRAQPECVSRMPVDLPCNIDRLSASEHLDASSLEHKKVEDSSEILLYGSRKLGASDIPVNGNARMRQEDQSKSCVNDNQRLSFLKNERPAMNFNSAVTSASPNGSTNQIEVSGPHAQRLTPAPTLRMQFGVHNGVASSGKAHTPNGRTQGDDRGQNHLLSRYWPKITNQELQRISGNSNSAITPLFEKTLSASDAGRIGRLVLPKKCAEAYFPPISQPEGLPLQVQDLEGKEWVFQFRFWPNNNSRMYVLEGVTPCIQSMQLQAGDIVIFSRSEPEGKLIMGFRKAKNTPPSNQVNETVNVSSGVSTHGAGNTKKSKANEVVSTNCHSKVEVLGPKSKRKNGTLGLKSKRLKVENEESIEVKITWGQAQRLLRPPPNRDPSVVVIEGFEFEEYQDAPIIGRPTIFPTDHMGIQWVQCEDCFKWRKIPADALLPARWTCSKNSWDPERSSCSVAQEISAEELDDLIHTTDRVPTKITNAAKKDPDPDPDKALEGLDALANLAIQEDGESLQSSSQATTKHPRHRPGCTCIVCIQPPSGTGPKHKQTCTCNLCLTMKRRFHTLMLRREKKQSENEDESLHKKQVHSSDQFHGDDILGSNEGSCSLNLKDLANEDPEDDPGQKKSSLSPFKGQIDLNIQPEREEELSSGSDCRDMVRFLQEASESYLERQKLLGSSGTGDSGGNQTQPGVAEGNSSNGIMVDSSLPDNKTDHPVTLPMNPPASESASGR